VVGPSPTDNSKTSRFPLIVYPSVLGVCDRGVRLRLAMATHPVWPPASPDSVATPEELAFAAEYPNEHPHGLERVLVDEF